MAAPTTALRNLAWLCEAVYYDDFVGPLKRTPKPIKILNDEKTSTQAAIYRFASPSPVTNDPNTLIVAVRGTSDRTDVGVDLDHEIVKAWDEADVDAHKGFADSAKLVYAAFEEHVPPGTPEIWITGHSLGGAVAHVYARHLLAAPEHPKLKVTLVTFGSPETFSQNEETTKNLQKREHTDRLHHMRCVNDRDGVTRAFIVNAGLKHHIEPTHLTYAAKSWFTTAFSNTPWSGIPMLVASYVPLLDVFADHSLVAYLSFDLEKVQADPATTDLGWD
jgi:hypothetical protein